MHLNLPILLTLALTGSALAADGYCNTDKTVTGQGGYTIKYPALSGGGTCIMNKGAEGAGVKDLQTSLNHCYGRSLVVDGDYGTNTFNAVLYAQKAEKMTSKDQDGIWGPKTGRAMDWWGSKKVSQGTETAWSCIKAIL